MSDQAIYAFCESKYRNLIVAIVTALVGLSLFLPLTDDYFDNSESRIAITDELDSVRKMEATLPKFKQRVAELENAAEELKELTLTEDSLTSYRDSLMKQVREAGCQLRTLEASQPTVRRWLLNDDPLKREAPPKKAKKTPFKLEKRGMTLLVDGDMTSINKLLESFSQGEEAVFPHRIKLSAAGGRGRSTTLEMNLWLFALTR